MILGDNMINSLEEFKKEYKVAAVVNYDIEDVHGYALCYRTSSPRMERVRKDRGRYITYPQIQRYSELDTNYKLFIIRNNKMYELEKGNKENTYHIKEEVTNVNLKIFDDKFYISRNQHKDPKIIDEPIYTIYE